MSGALGGCQPKRQQLFSLTATRRRNSCCLGLNVQPESWRLISLPELMLGGCFSYQQAVWAFSWSRQLISAQQTVHINTLIPRFCSEPDSKSLLRASDHLPASARLYFAQSNSDSWGEKLLGFDQADSFKLLVFSQLFRKKKQCVSICLYVALQKMPSSPSIITLTEIRKQYKCYI